MMICAEVMVLQVVPEAIFMPALTVVNFMQHTPHNCSQFNFHIAIPPIVNFYLCMK